MFWSVILHISEIQESTMQNQMLLGHLSLLSMLVPPWENYPYMIAIGKVKIMQVK